MPLPAKFRQYTPAQVAALTAMPLFQTTRKGTKDGRKDVKLGWQNFQLQQRHCRLYVAEAKAAIDGNSWPVVTVRQQQHLAEALEFAEEALDAADALVAQYAAAHPSRSGAAGTGAASGSAASASSAAVTVVVGSAGDAGGNSDDESDDDASVPHVPTEPLSCSDDDDEFGADGWD